MSFNYLEIARVGQAIAKELPDEVLGVELVEFPLGGAATLPDLNVGLRLANKRMVVFSLKAPWIGMYALGPGAWRTSRQTWASAFGGNVQDWNTYLKGQELERFEVVENDRIIILRFSNSAELRVELFPARPNWILTIGGVEYRWREPSKKAAPALRLRPDGVATPPPALREFEDRSGDWQERAYHYYLEARQSAFLASQVQRAQQQLQARLSQLIKIRGQMDTQMRETGKADALRAQAEELKGRLYEFKSGQRVAFVELFDGRKVELDRKITVSDNVARMFSRCKKLERTKREIEARRIGIEEENRKATGAIAKVRGFKAQEGEPFEKALARLLAILEEAGIRVDSLVPEERKERKEDKKWRKATEKHGLRRFESKEGLAIWLGRNHVENEELVIRLARGNDLWLHLKGRPGAHVIIQLPQGKTASLDTLLDAATLVAYYSGISEKEKVEVDYTFRKHVKRVPGGGEKFLVTYSQNKTLMLKLEDERLWRLLKQQ